MTHEIPLEKAIEMTKRYRENRGSILAPGHKPAMLAICETFNKASVLALLNEGTCEQLRIYYGMDDQLNIHAILVGADAEGNDLLPAADKAVAEEPPVILEDAQRCPSYCPPPSSLNQP
jgi:hypothetical protein